MKTLLFIGEILLAIALLGAGAYAIYKFRDKLGKVRGQLQWNKRTYISMFLLSLPIMIGITCMFFGAPWFILALWSLISVPYTYVSFFTSDIDQHYYVTLFGKNVGIIRSGSGLHLLAWPFFKTHAIPTEIVEGVFPCKENKIFFGDDTEALPMGMTRPYRIQSNNTDSKFQVPIIGIPKPEDIPTDQPEKRAFVEKLQRELTNLYKMIDDADVKHEEDDPLAHRLALEPRFLVKYKPLLDETLDDEAFSKQAEQFFKKFKDAEDLRGNVEESTLNILSNIFGKKLPRTLVDHQEIISEIMKLRLQFIYFDAGVDILEEGTGVQKIGVSKSVNKAIALNASAAAEKSAAIKKAEGEAKASELANNVELEKTKKANELAMTRLEKENELAGKKEQQILEGKALGMEKLLEKIGAKTSKEKIHAFELTVLENVLPETDLTVIAGQDGGGLGDLSKLLTKKLTNK